MRILIICACLCVFCGCGERSLTGTMYWFGDGYVGTHYHFTSDSTFALRGWSCTGGDTGIGHYKLIHDSLIFYFDSLEVSRLKTVTIDSSAADGDSCVFKITCRDLSETLPFVNVIYSRDTVRKGVTFTDLDGQAKFKVSKTDFPLNMEFRYAGFRTVRVEIGHEGNYSLDVRMHQSFLFVMPEGTVHAYAIKKFSKKHILLEFDYEIDGEKKTGHHHLHRGK